ncbi:MAG: hypothetical protein ACI8W7_004951 [Gammaproteobacteria bacterium]|jgi:hypothetical protein
MNSLSPLLRLSDVGNDDLGADLCVSRFGLGSTSKQRRSIAKSSTSATSATSSTMYERLHGSCLAAA